MTAEGEARTREVQAREIAALGLAGQGCAIAQLYGVSEAGVCACPKGEACTAPGKHGGKGWLEQATSDPAVIRTRFLRGDPNYGVVAPAGSRLMFVDEDTPGALETLGPLPDTLTVRTGRRADGTRGRHVYGALPDGIAEADIPYQWAGGEVRIAANGCVVGPYSRHRSGVLYEPLNGARIAELPEAWVRALIAAGVRRQATHPPGPDRSRRVADCLACGFLSDRVDGSRYAAILSLTMRLHLNGHRPDVQWQHVRDHLAPRFADPLTEAEVRERFDRATADPRRMDGKARAWQAEHEAPEPEASEPTAWPDPPAEAAYHGVLGDIARAVAPHTEADPVGVLGTLLAMFGAACGDGRSLYQGSLQRTNLSVLLVGATGFGGRKGTALDVARSVFRLAYPDLAGLWLVGVASGEAVTGHLARAVDGRPRYETEARVLIVETEFGRLLTIMNRDGSTLSPVLRNAWDGVPLGHARARDESLVSRHHVTILGHVTPVELRAKLTDTDAANGFANRLLFLAVRRTRLVPFPEPPDALVGPFVEPLHRAIIEAQTVGELTFDDDARDRWETFYAELGATPRLGLAGAVSGRHEAQVSRLALVYALADRSPAVGVAHLEAAIALAEYARRSVGWALGDSTGNRHADVLRAMLTDGEVGWDEARRALGLRTGADMAEAVAVLVAAGLAEVVRVRRPGPGRPRQMIRATGNNGDNGAYIAGVARGKEGESAT